MRLLPRPMLLRPGGIPFGDGWAFELKWDGFRAIVSTEDGLRVRSRRGWNMTAASPNSPSSPAVSCSTANSSRSTSGRAALAARLRAGPARQPFNPGHTRRVRRAAGRRTRHDVQPVGGSPCAARGAWRRTIVRAAERGLRRRGRAVRRCRGARSRGVVAKRRNGVYRPGYRGWTKIKNRGVLAGVREGRCSVSGIAPPRSATATPPTAEATSNQCSRE